MAKKKSAATTQQNWSDLPHDVLLLIISKLSYYFFDMLSLKGVCSSWRMAMRNRTIKAYPLLVSLADSEELDDKIVINKDFFISSVNDNRTYKFKKSPWFVEQYSRSSKIIGSHPDGWLILADDKVVYLLHLFLEIRIELPNKVLATNGSLVQCTEYIPSIKKAIMFVNDPTRPEDFIVVMSYYNVLSDKKPVFWRHGDCNWTCFGGESFVIDIAICNNTIYAIRLRHLKYDSYLESWDLKSNLSLPGKRFDLPYCPLGFIEPSADEFFLGNFDYRNSKWLIYKLDSRKNEWIKVISLNEHALNNHTVDSRSLVDASVILSSEDVELLGYKANSIHLKKKEQWQ